MDYLNLTANAPLYQTLANTLSERIREGYWADLVLVNHHSPWLVNKDNLLYKCGWSPFEGQEFSAAVDKTFVNGQLAYFNGKILEVGPGMRLEFER